MAETSKVFKPFICKTEGRKNNHKRLGQEKENGRSFQSSFFQIQLF